MESNIIILLVIIYLGYKLFINTKNAPKRRKVVWRR